MLDIFQEDDFVRPLHGHLESRILLRVSVTQSRGETHDAVHGSFINLMKLPNVEILILLVPASNHFMF